MSMRTLALQTTKDTQISSGAPTVGAGTDTTMRVHFSDIKGTQLLIRTLIEFDLSAIPAGSRIHSAVLTLTATEAPSGAFNINIHRLSEPRWTAAATWLTYDGSSPWASAGGDFGSTPPRGTMNTAGAGATASADLSSLVQDALQRGRLMLLLKTDEDGAPEEAIFSTSEDESAALRPKLELQYRSPRVSRVARVQRVSRF